MSADETKRWTRGWFLQCANTLFLGSFKIPGWLGLLFAIFWGVPAWHSKLEFWARVAKSSGGWLAPAAEVLLWPYFSPTLAIVSVVYLFVITRPKTSHARDVFVATLGWVCVTLVLAAAVAVFGSGAIEFYIRTEIARASQGLPRESSPADPKSPGNERPLFADGPRTITANQQRLLIGLGPELAGVGFVRITYSAADMEAYQFASELRGALVMAAVEAAQPAEQFRSNTTDLGLMIEVKDKNQPPEGALKLQRALAVLDLQARFVDLPARFGETPFVLFVGPRPIQR